MPKDQQSQSLMIHIKETPIPRGHVGIWFLGQNSFICKDSQSFIVAIDPYLSDYCATRGIVPGPTEKSRRFPPPIQPAELDVDLVLLTHSHCDHADPETLEGISRALFQSGKEEKAASPLSKEDEASPSSSLATPHQTPTLRVAGPRLALEVAKKAGIPVERLRLIQAGEEVFFPKRPGILAAAERLREKKPEMGILVRGTFAIPTDTSDLTHMGFLIRFADGITLWNTGDTAWSSHLLELAGKDIKNTVEQWKGPQPLDLMMVCINAGYGNLSHWEAARLAGVATPRVVIPTHYDLFPHNSLDPRPFKTSVEKNAPSSQCQILEVPRGYLYTEGRLETLAGLQ